MGFLKIALWAFVPFLMQASPAFVDVNIDEEAVPSQRSAPASEGSSQAAPVDPKKMQAPAQGPVRHKLLETGTLLLKVQVAGQDLKRGPKVAPKDSGNAARAAVKRAAKKGKLAKKSADPTAGLADQALFQEAPVEDASDPAEEGDEVDTENKDPAQDAWQKKLLKAKLKETLSDKKAPSRP